MVILPVVLVPAVMFVEKYMYFLLRAVSWLTRVPRQYFTYATNGE